MQEELEYKLQGDQKSKKHAEKERGPLYHLSLRHRLRKIEFQKLDRILTVGLQLQELVKRWHLK